MLADFGGGGGAYDGGEGVGGGLLDAADGAEVLEQALAGAGADAGDGVELGVAVADFAAFAVVGDGEAMALVADLLDEMEDGGAAVEDDGVVFLAEDVDDLFALGDGGEGLEGVAGLDADLLEGGGGGGELAEAAVDEDQDLETVFCLPGGGGSGGG